MAESTPPRFFGYPKAKEGPSIPYHKPKDINPVFSGMVLVIGAWIVSKLGFIQKYLWANAGFDALRKLDLKGYTECWDPTVVPLRLPDSDPDVSKQVSSDPAPPKTKIPNSKYRTVAEYHALYLSGEATPLAVVKALIPLINRDGKDCSHHSKAFIYSDYMKILQVAKESTARYQQGCPLSVLDGVPTAIKDEVDAKGYRTTYGRNLNGQDLKLAERSAWPVEKWEEAGVIIMGKLNMHELGADTTNLNPTYGTPLNPHNSSYYTGGSSGGPAYAVSAGLIPFALGTDGGGSIRIPSSFCGIYGLKTSHHRLLDTGSTVTVLGPMAATMEDLDIVYKVMAKPNPEDPICGLFAPPLEKPLLASPKKLGIYRPWFDRAEPGVLKACNDAVKYYKTTLGYEIVDIYLPYVPEAQIAHTFTIMAEMSIRARALTADPKGWLNGLTAANKVLLSLGSQTPTTDYLLGQQLRQLIMQHLSFLFQTHPGLIIVSPTTPMPGWPINHPSDLTHGISDGNKSIRNMEYVWLANFSGCPAISIPVGFVEPEKGEGRIPVGLMGMGEWGSEQSLIVLGREGEEYVENVLQGGRVIPSNWVDVIADAKERKV